jgi:competence protein ComEC
VTELIILDVGHGNCSLLRSDGETAVIDAPTGSLLLDTLRDLGITTVDAAFVSHADKDHLAGITAILASRDVVVRTVFLNPDAQRRSKLWESFRSAVTLAERQGTCVVSTSLSTTSPGEVRIGSATVRVVAPSAALALTGVGGRTPNDRLVTANSLSAVLSIRVGSDPSVLLTGDMDDVGLDDALSHGAVFAANVLVFPHHGGSPGGDPVGFTQRLLDSVRPHSVYFSNGRGRYENPQPLIVATAVSQGCAIACTQLAHACSDTSLESEHLEAIRSHGRAHGRACAGSMTLALVGGAQRSSRSAENAHATFVGRVVPTPMCRNQNVPLVHAATAI